MDSFNVMVVEANTGLGLEFVRQFALLPNPPEHIFATYSEGETLKVRFCKYFFKITSKCKCYK